MSFETTSTIEWSFPSIYPGFETGTLFGTVTPASISSAEAFGVPDIRGPVIPDSIASAEAFGSPQVNLQILADAIASAEAFGSPTIVVIARPDSIPSAEAFGTPVVAGPVTADGIASAEAFGSPQLNLQVPLDGIASAETFGTLAVIPPPVPVDGIPSAEAFGTPVLAGPVTLTGVPSAEAFGFLEIENFGALRVVGAAQGVAGSPSQLTLAGAVLDMSPCSDDFQAGYIDSSKWSVVTAGTGQALPQMGYVSLRALVAADAAILRSVDTATDLYATASFAPQDAVARQGGPVVLGELRLHIDASNYARVAIEYEAQVAYFVAEAVSGGVTTYSRRTIGARGLPTAFDLRLLRAGTQVFAEINGQTMGTFFWTDAAASIDLRVFAHPTLPSSAASRATNFVRRPLILVGDEPVRDFLLESEGRLIVAVPVVRAPGVKDLAVTGCAFSETLVNGFEYVLGGQAQIRAGTSTMTILNDGTLGD